MSIFRSCATRRFRCNQVFRGTFDGLQLALEEIHGPFGKTRPNPRKQPSAEVLRERHLRCEPIGAAAQARADPTGGVEDSIQESHAGQWRLGAAIEAPNTIDTPDVPEGCPHVGGVPADIEAIRRLKIDLDRVEWVPRRNTADATNASGDEVTHAFG